MKSGKIIFLVLSLLLVMVISPVGVYSEPTEDDPDLDHPWGGEASDGGLDEPDVYLFNIGIPLLVDLSYIDRLTSDTGVKIIAEPEIQPQQTANSIYSEPVRIGKSTVER